MTNTELDMTKVETNVCHVHVDIFRLRKTLICIYRTFYQRETHTCSPLCPIPQVEVFLSDKHAQSHKNSYMHKTTRSFVHTSTPKYLYTIKRHYHPADTTNICLNDNLTSNVNVANKHEQICAINN